MDFIFCISSYKKWVFSKAFWGGDVFILLVSVNQEVRVSQCPHLSEIMAGKEVGQAPVPPE